MNGAPVNTPSTATSVSYRITTIVNCGSETGFAGGFLRVFQLLFFAVQLLLQALRFLLLSQLVLVVLDAVGVAVGLNEMN